MVDEGISIRKIIAGFSLLVFLIVGFILLFQYLTTAQITITTDNPKNSVKVAGILGEKNASYSKQAPAYLHVRVKPGRYEIYAYGENKSGGYSRVIEVKARQNLHFNLVPKGFVASEPVYSHEVADVAVNSSYIRFIDLGSFEGGLESIGTHNTVAGIMPDAGFVEAKWADPELGLAKTGDNFLYLIKGSSAKKISLPFSPSENQDYSYDITKNGNIYLAFNGDVFSGQGTDNFQKVYPGGGSNLTVSAGYDKAVAFERTAAVGADESGSVKSQGGNGHLMVVLGQNKITKKTAGFSSVIWSPSGKYLLATGPSGGEILNAKLQTISRLTINNADFYAWTDDETIMYAPNGSGNQLWSYNLNSKDSVQVAQLSGGENITSIYPDQSGQYVYLSVSINGRGYLARVGLRGQQPDNSLSLLPVFLPETVNGCSIGYINFTVPIIQVAPPYGQDPLDCMGTAKEEILYYGVNPDSVNFVSTQ